MMLTCDMAMDLVSLYQDKVASEDTVRAVNLHLKNCPKCREYYRSYNSIKKLDEKKYTVPEEEMQYKDISVRLSKRHTIKTSVVTAITLASAVYVVLNIAKWLKGEDFDDIFHND